MSFPDHVSEDDVSDDEFFDANNEMPSGLSVEQQDAEVISPSISIISFEGDPPEIEEDKDYHEINSGEGLSLKNLMNPCLCSVFFYRYSTI